MIRLRYSRVHYLLSHVINVEITPGPLISEGLNQGHISLPQPSIIGQGIGSAIGRNIEIEATKSRQVNFVTPPLPLWGTNIPRGGVSGGSYNCDGVSIDRQYTFPLELTQDSTVHFHDNTIVKRYELKFLGPSMKKSYNQFCSKPDHFIFPLPWPIYIRYFI